MAEQAELTVGIRFRSNARLLQLIRVIASQVAEMSGFGPEEVQGIALAVDEACSNIIRHAYGNCSDGEIEMEVSSSPGGIEFLLIHHGEAPSPEQLRPRDLDEVRPGGLGTFLIRSVMNEVEYRCGERGNELYLAKWLSPPRRAKTSVLAE